MNQIQGTYLQWNETYGVLVDQQGLMIPTCVLKALADKMHQHLQHSSLELEAIGRRTVEENHPSMVNQFNFEYFR